MNDFDIERARRDTPGCENIIHFNNAGASLMPNPVLESMIDHLKLEASLGGYEAAERSREKIEHFYEAVSQLLGCRTEEIAFVENATRAWDMAFYAIPFRPGDRILTATAEYASNYIAFLQVAARTGARVEVIPSDPEGQVSVNALKSMLDERVRLVAVTHVPTNGGLVNPIVEIGRALGEDGPLYLVDACQSSGQMPLPVKEIGCHILSATGRKFLRGPRGTGFLCVRKDLIERLDPPFLDLHSARWVSPGEYTVRPDARRFECWEANYAGKIGLATAVDYALSWGMESIWTRVQGLAEVLRVRLGQVRGVRVHDLGVRRCGIVSFTVEGKDAEEVRRFLLERRIHVSVCTRQGTLLDMDSRGLQALLRASVHYYNTEEEIGRFCEVLADIP
ncbi:MAG: aminotransferase class V-fold PLP-dependent enzyme [Thermodesulfobacteriota bacterium]